MEIVPITSFLKRLLPNEELHVWTSNRNGPTSVTLTPIDRPVSDCTICPGAIIGSAVELRAHFKTDWHLHNLRARQSGETVLRESDFVAPDNNGGSSSSSCSSTSEVYSEDEDGRTTPGTPMVQFCRSGADRDQGIIYEVYKAVLHEYEELYERHHIDYSSLTLRSRLTNLSESSWLLLLIRSGRVACAVFDNRDGRMVQSKTFKRYTVRRKQGGSQLARDAAGSGRIKSAGAHIRRRNEMHLIEDVRQLVSEWDSVIGRCSLVFWIPTMTGRLCLTDSTVLSLEDRRLRTIPFTTYKPSLEEVQRCYRRLSGVHLVRRMET